MNLLLLFHCSNVYFVIFKCFKQVYSCILKSARVYTSTETEFVFVLLLDGVHDVPTVESIACEGLDRWPLCLTSGRAAFSVHPKFSLGAAKCSQRRHRLDVQSNTSRRRSVHFGSFRRSTRDAFCNTPRRRCQVQVLRVVRLLWNAVSS